MHTCIDLQCVLTPTKKKTVLDNLCYFGTSTEEHVDCTAEVEIRIRNWLAINQK